VSADYAPPPARPLGLAGIMRTALTMYRAVPIAFMLVALVSTLPEAILLIGSQLAYGGPSTRLRELVQELLTLLPQLLLGQLSIAASTVLMLHMLNGQRPNPGVALERVGDRFWPLVGVVCITTIGILAGFVALLIPGIYLFVVWLVAPIAVVTEQRSIRDAIGRSVALVRGHFWWVLGSWLAIQITVGLAGVLISDLINIPLGAVGGTLGIVLRGLGAFIALTLVAPVANAGVALIYIDLRLHEHPVWPVPPMRSSRSAA
jgi:hypothetical protein